MKRGAELRFVERANGTGWNGSLVSPDEMDRVTGKRAGNYAARIANRPAYQEAMRANLAPPPPATEKHDA